MRGNHAEAEDVLEQVMVKAWQELEDSTETIAVPRAWLTRLARNLCIDAHRDSARRAKVVRRLEDWMQSGGDPVACSGESSDRALIEAESEAEIRRQVEHLPSQLREPFVLRFFQEESCEQIGAKLGLSPASVRKRLQLARASLRESWDRGFSKSAPMSSAPAPARPVQTLPPAAVVRQRLWEICKPTAVMRLVPVRLPCGVERYCRVFLARQPGRERQKIKSLREYLAGHPGSRKRLEELGQLLYGTGAWPDAVEACRQFLEKEPRAIPMALLLGDMLFLSGKPTEAASAYSGALAWAQQAASQCHFNGLIAACGQEWARAAECFKNALGEQPENPAHLHALAWAELQVGRPRQALLALESALKRDSKDLVALNLAQATVLSAGFDEPCPAQVVRALATAPMEAVALTRLAGQLGKPTMDRPETPEQEKSLLRLALRQAPSSPTVIVALAEHFLAQDDRRRGLELLQRLHERYPGCRFVGRHYCRVQESSGAKRACGGASNADEARCAGTCRLAGVFAGF